MSANSDLGDDHQSTSNAMPDEATVRANRHKLAWLIIIPMCIILSAQLLWWLSVQGNIDLPGLIGTKNKGLLLQQPLNISDIPLQDAQGNKIGWADGPGENKWRLIIPVPAVCTEVCLKRLAYIHNAHIALGRLYDSVGEYHWLANAEQELDPTVAINRIYADQESFYQRLEATAGASDAELYLLDDRGNVVLFYPQGFDGRDMISDIKFLIKSQPES